MGRGKTIEQMRPKEAYFRDALVKAAHRTPFSVAGDWTRLDEARLSSASGVRRQQHKRPRLDHAG
ncbi:hypothetical protein A1F99_142760 [Pyrenophora tritici-repentis]|nr:hypothetical protein A1F99_142760 [Pyrenophora tritici-repentis]